MGSVTGKTTFPEDIINTYHGRRSTPGPRRSHAVGRGGARPSPGQCDVPTRGWEVPLVFSSSQVKIYSPVIHRAGRGRKHGTCPQGGLGCGCVRCPSSVSCVGWVYVRWRCAFCDCSSLVVASMSHARRGRACPVCDSATTQVRCPEDQKSEGCSVSRLRCLLCCLGRCGLFFAATSCCCLLHEVASWFSVVVGT